MKSYSDNEFLWDQFIRLGEMLGDGLGDEPDGKWIGKEYKRIARVLGIYKEHRKNNNEKINEFMEKRITETKCNCGGNLRQSRKGSFIGVCVKCGNRYRLGHISRRRKKR